MTLSQSMATLSGKIPRSETFAPFEVFSKMSFSPLGWPDISSATSKPSFILSCFLTSVRDSLATLTVRVAPSFSASARRYGLTSVTTT